MSLLVAMKNKFVCLERMVYGLGWRIDKTHY